MFSFSAVVICSALLSMPPLIGWSAYVYTPTHSFCFADWANHMSYSFFMIGCCFGVPFAVMTVCNIFIIRSVRHSRMRVKSNIINSTVSGNFSSTMFQRGGSRISKFEDNSCFNETVPSYNDIDKSKPISIVEEPEETKTNDEPASRENNNEKADKPNVLHLEFSDESSTDHSRSKTNLDRFSDASETDISSCLITHKAVDKVSIEKVHLRKLNMATKDVKEIIDLKSSKTLPKDKDLLHPSWPSKAEEVTSSISVTVESSTEVTINIDPPSASCESGPDPVLRRKRGSPLLRRREEIRLAFSLVVVVVIFVICWLPYCISMLISVFYKGHVPREFHMFTLVIGYANSGCNPIVYGVMNKRFKVGFKRLFCFWKRPELSYSST